MKLRQATTTILFFAATLLAPSALSAQFTTFVAPPQKQPAETTAKPMVATAKTKADSVRRMTLTDMKAWVDSAAGTSTQLASASDTTNAAAPNAAAPLTPAPNVERRTTAFSNGAVAPSTATALPTYLVTGLVVFAVGLLVRRRRQPRS